MHQNPTMISSAKLPLQISVSIRMYASVIVGCLLLLESLFIYTLFVLDECDIVVDVGGEYNPDKLRY